MIHSFKSSRLGRILGSRAWRVTAVVLACAVWTIGNGVWLIQNRAGQPLNIDESGYLGIALNYSFGWVRGGPAGWVTSVLWPSQHAPLTTALTSLALLTGYGPLRVAFGVILAFGALTLLLTAAYAALTGDRVVVAVSLVLVATTPGFITLSRDFTFAVPATAITLLALYALIRSRGLVSIRWSVVFGISVGLMPLTRTMTIAFVPVILLAAVVYAAAHEGRRRRRFANLAAATVLGAVVTGIWLVPSARLVFGYLTKYGYGAHSVEYTTHAASPPLALLATLSNEYRVPHMVLFAVGALTVVGAGVAAMRRDPSWSRARTLLASPLSPLMMFLAGASVALMSSDNGGFGFTIPLLPPAALVAAAGWSRLMKRARAGRSRIVIFAVILGLCGLLVYPSFDSNTPLADPRSVDLLGTSLTVSSGRGLDPAYQFPVSNRRGWNKGWEVAFSRLTSNVLDGTPAHQSVAFGFRGYFTNVNVVELRAVERLHYGIAAAQIDPLLTDDTVPAYVEWLTVGDAASSCHLMTSPGTVNEFTPVIDTTAMETAAMQVGFKSVDLVPTPDGRKVTVWERSGNGC